VDRRLAWSLLVLAALAALLASVAFVGMSRPQTLVRRVLPDHLPADVPNGTIDTPLGKARWVHLTGDPTTLSQPYAPMITPSGLSLARQRRVSHRRARIPASSPCTTTARHGWTRTTRDPGRAAAPDQAERPSWGSWRHLLARDRRSASL
jgi:hypothetical protein